MSKKSKKATSATAVENASPNAATHSAANEVPATPKARPVMCLTVSSIPDVPKAKGQQRLVLNALDTKMKDNPGLLGEPLILSVLAVNLADYIKANQDPAEQYKVKNGDVAGSVGFWLVQLSNAHPESIRRFQARPTEDGGYDEVVPAAK